MEIDQKKFKIDLDPVTVDSVRERFGDCLPSMPRPQQIESDVTSLFSVVNPNTRQLLDAKEKALASLKSSLEYLRVLTIECNIEEPPQIYKDVREAIRILENDVKL